MLNGSPPECWNRLKSLADRACEGDLAMDGSGELAGLLTADEANRDWYVAYMRLNAWLDYDAALVSASPFSFTGTAPLEESAGGDFAQVLGVDPWRSFDPARATHAAPYKTRSAIAASLAAAVLFYGTFVLVAWNLRSGKLAQETGDGPVVALVSGSQEVTWSNAMRPKAADEAVVKGETLQIDSGTLELQLAQGAMLIIEGPAEWTIDGDNQAALKHGKLIAKVPARAIGFALETPTAHIVDLGTEFGVTVDEQGNTDVQVHQGKVQIGDDPTSRVTLVGGESRRITREQGISALPVSTGLPSTPAAELLADLDAQNSDIDSDWLMPRCWNEGQLPTRESHCHVGGTEEEVRLRTPQTLNPAPFGGGALSVHPTGMLALKHIGKVRIDDLRLAGGQLNVWESRVNERELGLSGRLRVVEDSEFVLHGCVFNLASIVEGTGQLKVTGLGTLVLSSGNAGYRGNWQVENALLVPMAAGSLGAGRVTLAAAGHMEIQRSTESSQVALALTKGASVMLWKSLTVREVSIDGEPLAAGTFPVAELKRRFPGYFHGSGGSLTVFENTVESPQ